MKDKKFEIIGIISTAIVSFVVYLLMRRFILSDRILPEDYMIAAAISIAIVISQIVMRIRKRKNDDSVIDQ